MATGPAVTVDLTAMQFGGAPPLFGTLKFDVAPGEVVALIGPSGVGKTTLLRIIGGLERGYAGRCLVAGVRADQAPPPGYVFQDARLLPWLAASANLRAVRPDLGQAQVEDLLRRVGLGGLSAAYPRQMSGGMQRRLGLARAISANPGLLLLDEPFVSLDRVVVRDLQDLFQTIFRAENPTVVLVSHDPEDAARLADRVIVLNGRPARIVGDFRFDRADQGRDPPEIARLVAILLDAQHKVLQ